MTRISELFKRKNSNILSVYFTAGFPNLNDTMPIIKALDKAGIDMIEVGVPFSDPLADGPVIQRSGSLALKNGISQKVIFEQLKDLRKETQMPIVLMGYVNPVLQYGIENFCKSAVEIGADGIILPDLPLDQYKKDFKETIKKYGLDFILLITPETSDERIREIDAESGGFIYMVSSNSTTGAQKSFNDGRMEYFKRIKAMNLNHPTLVGFGVSNNETYKAACEGSCGAIVGSQFIKELEANPTIEDAVASLVKKIKG